MKAVRIQRYGGPEVLELVEVPAPAANPDQVVVQVAATAVNPVDWLIRDGAAKSFVRVRFPVILGCEFAGTVVEVGANVSRFAVGDEVFGMMSQDFGAHAERVAVPERLVVKKPSSLTMEQAAALPVAALTALNGLRRRARVRAGDRVLVNGASGGVGLAAVQIAKALGAHVTAVCGAAIGEQVRALGADAVIDYRSTDFTQGDEQWDVVFDCVGTAPYRACRRVLGGRRVHVTTMPNVSVFLRQALNPLSSTKVFGLITKGDGDALQFVKELVERGQLRPLIDKVYPLSEVAAAQEYSKTRRAKGKIVLSV